MKPCAATAAEEHNGEGGVRNGIPLAPSWSESESVGRSCCHRTRDRLPTVSSLHFQQSLLPSRSLARGGLEGREREGELAGSSSVQPLSDPFFRACVLFGYLWRRRGSERARASTGSGVGCAADGAGRGCAVVWPRGGREGGRRWYSSCCSRFSPWLVEPRTIL